MLAPSPMRQLTASSQPPRHSFVRKIGTGRGVVAQPSVSANKADAKRDTKRAVKFIDAA